MTRDFAESVSNALVGLGVSLALVFLLRATGFWDAPATLIAALFFLASVARAFVLRRLFRRAEK